MARVTVEDCMQKIDNRFELVVLAAERARHISSGAEITVNDDNDKNPVIALREIAVGNVTPDSLRKSQLSSLQKNNTMDEVLEDNTPEHSPEELNYSDAIDDVFLD